MPSASLTVVGGSFSNNAVAGGTPVYDTGPNAIGNRRSAYGADLFLGANVTFSITGNLADFNVANNANDPNAQGTTVVTVGENAGDVGTLALGSAGLACGRCMLRRQMPAGGPRLSSLS